MWSLPPTGRLAPVRVDLRVALVAADLDAPLGITICGEISVRYQIERGELVAMPLKDKGLDLRNIEVQTLVGRTLSRTAQAFLDYLKTQMAG